MPTAEFDAYLPLTDEQKRLLWQKATFVLDTNVFLRLYKYGHVTRQQVMAALAALKNRVWIPYHVCVEFYRNRLNQLGAEKSRVESTIGQLRAAHTKLLNEIQQANLAEIGLEENSTELAAIETSIQKLCERLLSVRDAAPDLTADDSVLKFFQELVGSNYGASPATQAGLDALVSDGEERYRSEE